MILKKAYGETTVTGAAALLMALSMIISESLVARTFGTYTLQLFPSDPAGIWVPVLAVGLIVVAKDYSLAEAASPARRYTSTTSPHPKHFVPYKVGQAQLA